MNEPESIEKKNEVIKKIYQDSETITDNNQQ